MQGYFYELADFIQTQLAGGEAFTAAYDAEDSEFVRFNKGRVRQAGTVEQATLGIDLIDGRRHAWAGMTLSRNEETDRGRVREMVQGLRDMLPHLPEDPHHLYSREVRSSERHGENRLPPRSEPVDSILRLGTGTDLVGIYSAGGICAGFANSFGQRNWYSTHTFNLDWSVYHHNDKAVKLGYGGFEWSDTRLADKMALAREQLDIVGRTPRTIDPGGYRVYLSPVAMYEILSTLSRGGFGLKTHRTKQTPLLRMVEGDARFNDCVTILENTADGVAPNFQAAGFIKPNRVSLIKGGCFGDCLVSPRSAQEYSVETNGAATYEMPESIDMAPGGLARDDIVKELGTGLYINNLWYLNYSDRPACRITGMTRFATFWVENGRITAPVNVMRFDETIYRILGDKLVDLTAEREFILDAATYYGRSTSSVRLPGALVEDFTFTL